LDKISNTFIENEIIFDEIKLLNYVCRNIFDQSELPDLGAARKKLNEINFFSAAARSGNGRSLACTDLDGTQIGSSHRRILV
jgi:hypothetical protein